MNNLHSRPDRLAGAAQSGHACEPAFPSARYFQLHFNYINDTLAMMGQELAVLKARIDGLEAALRPEPADGRPAPQGIEKRRDN